MVFTMVRHFTHPHHLVTVCALLACVLCLTHAYAVDPAGRTPRTTALTCCERAEEAWTILSAWQRSCARAASRRTLTPAKFAAMLTQQSRTAIASTAVAAVCDAGDGGSALGREAVAAYFRYALCSSLPRSHGELARSVYSALMDEAPALEDELTDDMVSACRELQIRWTAEADAWVQQLRGSATLAAAQAALCTQPCRWKEDLIDGFTYDL